MIIEDRYKYMVNVDCMTYNHAPYIIDTMDGFVKQETTFPFVCTIIDDASTDGEQEVIKKYLKNYFVYDDEVFVSPKETDDYSLTFVRHKKNRNCFFAVLFLKYNHYLKKDKTQYVKEWRDSSKYLALCEGDDYWTDPLKLQKQVDFMEKNKKFVLCTHSFSKFYDNTGTLEDCKDLRKNFSFDTKIYLKRFPAQPLTALWRRKAEPTLQEQMQHKFFFDVHLFYYILKHGHGYFMNENMGVYRITEKGIWTSMSIQKRISSDVKWYFDLYSKNRKDIYLWRKCVRLYGSYLYYCEYKTGEKEIIDAKESIGYIGVIIARILKSLYTSSLVYCTKKVMSYLHR